MNARRVLPFAFHEEMEVVGHIAGRNDGELFIHGGAQNLRTNQIDALVIDESSMEIGILSEVIQTL